MTKPRSGYKALFAAIAVANMPMAHAQEQPTTALVPDVGGFEAEVVTCSAKGRLTLFMFKQKVTRYGTFTPEQNQAIADLKLKEANDYAHIATDIQAGLMPNKMDYFKAATEEIGAQIHKILKAGQVIEFGPLDMLYIKHPSQGCQFTGDPKEPYTLFDLPKQDLGEPII